MVPARLLMNLIMSFARSIGRRGLSCEEEGAGRHLEIRVFPQPVVQHDDSQCVQELPLIFVNPLHLTIDNSVGIDRFRRSLL